MAAAVWNGGNKVLNAETPLLGRKLSKVNQRIDQDQFQIQIGDGGMGKQKR